MFFQCVSSNFSVVDKNIYVSLKIDISKIKENVTIAMDYIDFQDTPVWLNNLIITLFYLVFLVLKSLKYRSVLGN